MTAALQILFDALSLGSLYALGALGITLAYRWLPGRSVATRLALLPALVAAIWVTRESVGGMFPYGGFPWGRLGLSQAESPLGAVTSWLGVSGLSFVIVIISASLIEWARMGAWRTRPGRLGGGRARPSPASSAAKASRSR